MTGLPAEQLGGIRIRSSGTGYTDDTQTDDTGKFTLQNVPSGVITLTATTAVLTGRTTSKTVEVADGAGEIPVEIAFEGQSKLSGRVTRGSAPMPGLFVLAAPDPPDGSGRHTAQTDSDGHYELDGMNDGDYQVSVNGGGVSYRKEFTVSGDTNGDIELPGTTITGRVTDSSTGDAVESAVRGRRDGTGDAIGLGQARHDGLERRATRSPTWIRAATRSPRASPATS